MRKRSSSSRPQLQGWTKHPKYQMLHIGAQATKPLKPRGYEMSTKVEKLSKNHRIPENGAHSAEDIRCFTKDLLFQAPRGSSAFTTQCWPPGALQDPLLLKLGSHF